MTGLVSSWSWRPRKSERDAGVFEIGDTLAAGWRTDAERLLPNMSNQEQQGEDK